MISDSVDLYQPFGVLLGVLHRTQPALESSGRRPRKPQLEKNFWKCSKATISIHRSQQPAKCQGRANVTFASNDSLCSLIRNWWSWFFLRKSSLRSHYSAPPPPTRRSHGLPPSTQSLPPSHYIGPSHPQLSLCISFTLLLPFTRPNSFQS